MCGHLVVCLPRRGSDRIGSVQPGHSHAKARTFSNSRSCVASQTSLVPASRPSSIVAPWHVTGRRLVKLEPRPPSGAPRPRVTWRSQLVPISAQFTARDASKPLCGKRDFTGPDWAPLLTKAGETAHTLRRSCATRPRHFFAARRAYAPKTETADSPRDEARPIIPSGGAAAIRTACCAGALAYCRTFSP